MLTYITWRQKNYCYQVTAIIAMNELIKIGIICCAHGIKGEMKIKPLTDFLKRFIKMNDVVINGKKYNIEKVAQIKNKEYFLIKLANINDRTSAERFNNQYLEITQNELTPLSEGTYYIFEIIGCKVYEEKRLLGKIIDVYRTISNDIYIVESEQNECILIPAIKRVVKHIDIINKQIKVKILKEI